MAKSQTKHYQDEHLTHNYSYSWSWFWIMLMVVFVGVAVASLFLFDDDSIAYTEATVGSPIHVSIPTTTITYASLTYTETGDTPMAVLVGRYSEGDKVCVWYDKSYPNEPHQVINHSWYFLFGFIFFMFFLFIIFSMLWL